MKRTLTLFALAGLLASACFSSSAEASNFAERCERNKAAGTISLVTGFDYAASPGIIDAITAEARGYYAEACLAVEILPGFAPANRALVTSGEAQFAQVGSFSGIAKTESDSDHLVAVLHYGKAPIEALVVPADSEIESVADLPGHLVGVKGALPNPIRAMIQGAGVEEDTFDELILETYDPIEAFDLGVDALPVYKSNETHQLDEAGFDYRMFDPLDAGIPSSFGMVATSASFLEENPEVVSDFVNATLRGMQHAIDNPTDALDAVMAKIEATEGASQLSERAERARWGIERQLMLATTPPGVGVGVIDEDLLEQEIEMLTSIGLFETEPDWRNMIAPDIAGDLYDGATLKHVGT